MKYAKMLVVALTLAVCSQARALDWCVAPVADVTDYAHGWYAEQGGDYYAELDEPEFCQSTVGDTETYVESRKLTKPTGWLEVALPCMVPPVGGGSVSLTASFYRESGNAILLLVFELLQNGEVIAHIQQPTIYNDYAASFYSVPMPTDWSNLSVRVQALKYPSSQGSAPVASVSAVGLYGASWVSAPALCN